MNTSDPPTPDIEPSEDDPPRPGEVVLDAPLRADASLIFIGRIETPWLSRDACPRQGDPADGPDCRLHLLPIWEPALDGLPVPTDQDPPELQVMYWMHLARRNLVLLVPRSHADARPRGPFALRAPTRPNPIASSVVRLLGRSGAVLTVRGLDCVNGTPLLDIKPWRSRTG